MTSGSREVLMAAATAAMQSVSSAQGPLQVLQAAQLAAQQLPTVQPIAPGGPAQAAQAAQAATRPVAQPQAKERQQEQQQQVPLPQPQQPPKPRGQQMQKPAPPLPQQQKQGEARCSQQPAAVAAAAPGTAGTHAGRGCSIHKQPAADGLPRTDSKAAGIPPAAAGGRTAVSCPPAASFPTSILKDLNAPTAEPPKQQQEPNLRKRAQQGKGVAASPRVTRARRKRKLHEVARQERQEQEQVHAMMPPPPPMTAFPEAAGGNALACLIQREPAEPTGSKPSKVPAAIADDGQQLQAQPQQRVHRWMKALQRRPGASAQKADATARSAGPGAAGLKWRKLAPSTQLAEKPLPAGMSSPPAASAQPAAGPALAMPPAGAIKGAAADSGSLAPGLSAAGGGAGLQKLLRRLLRPAAEAELLSQEGAQEKRATAEALIPGNGVNPPAAAAAVPSVAASPDGAVAGASCGLPLPILPAGVHGQHERPSMLPQEEVRPQQATLAGAAVCSQQPPYSAGASNPRQQQQQGELSVQGLTEEQGEEHERRRVAAALQAIHDLFESSSEECEADEPVLLPLGTASPPAAHTAAAPAAAAPTLVLQAGLPAATVPLLAVSLPAAQAASDLARLRELAAVQTAGAPANKAAPAVSSGWNLVAGAWAAPPALHAQRPRAGRLKWRLACRMQGVAFSAVVAAPPAAAAAVASRAINLSADGGAWLPQHGERAATWLHQAKQQAEHWTRLAGEPSHEPWLADADNHAQLLLPPAAAKIWRQHKAGKVARKRAPAKQIQKAAQPLPPSEVQVNTLLQQLQLLLPEVPVQSLLQQVQHPQTLAERQAPPPRHPPTQQQQQQRKLHSSMLQPQHQPQAVLTALSLLQLAAPAFVHHQPGAAARAASPQPSQQQLAHGGARPEPPQQAQARSALPGPLQQPARGLPGQQAAREAVEPAAWKQAGKPADQTQTAPAGLAQPVPQQQTAPGSTVPGPQQQAAPSSTQLAPALQHLAAADLPVGSPQQAAPKLAPVAGEGLSHMVGCVEQQAAANMVSAFLQKAHNPASPSWQAAPTKPALQPEGQTDTAGQQRPAAAAGKPRQPAQAGGSAGQQPGPAAAGKPREPAQTGGSTGQQRPAGAVASPRQPAQAAMGEGQQPAQAAAGKPRPPGKPLARALMGAARAAAAAAAGPPCAGTKRLVTGVKSFLYREGTTGREADVVLSWMGAVPSGATARRLAVAALFEGQQWLEVDGIRADEQGVAFHLSLPTGQQSQQRQTLYDMLLAQLRQH